MAVLHHGEVIDGAIMELAPPLVLPGIREVVRGHAVCLPPDIPLVRAKGLGGSAVFSGKCRGKQSVSRFRAIYISEAAWGLALQGLPAQRNL